MQLLGSIKHVARCNLLVVKCHSVWDLNSAAKLLKKPVFSDKEKIGEIQEIFGPVAAPYISVKPLAGIKASNLANKSAYIQSKKTNLSR